MVSRRKELKKEAPVLGGYKKSDYASERVFARSDDGVEIPISLFYKKGFRKDGTAPLLLTGYGAYGHSTDANLSSSTITLVDRGIVFAIAHIRASAELGRTWYDDGKLL